MGALMATQTLRLAQTMTYVLTIMRLKQCYVIPQALRAIFIKHNWVFSFVAALTTHRHSLNGFASYFDPLTKYCLATQALI